MNVVYQDEYGVVLYTSTTPALPSINDAIIFDETELIVKNRVFYPLLDTVSIVVSEAFFRKTVDTNTESGRLNKLNALMLEMEKRQDNIETNSKHLAEQLHTVKKHITYKDKK